MTFTFFLSQDISNIFLFRKNKSEIYTHLFSLNLMYKIKLDILLLLLFNHALISI